VLSKPNTAPSEAVVVDVDGKKKISPVRRHTTPKGCATAIKAMAPTLKFYIPE
jgi:hypothetical protein